MGQLCGKHLKVACFGFTVSNQSGGAELGAENRKPRLSRLAGITPAEPHGAGL
jgi:hypothetical protein